VASTSDPDDDRREVERGLRTALLVVEELRADVLRLAAQVVAQGEALARVGATAADPDVAAVASEDAIATRTDELAALIATRDTGNAVRLEIAAPVDKYAVVGAGPPCDELLPICGARCCRFAFPLSSQDLDEGVIRWDHGRPYLIRHDANGDCTHLDRARGGGCTAYEHRPATCRTYDCRNDPRVWIDFERRELAPLDAARREASPTELAAVGRERTAGLAAELVTLRLRR
jgi:hypothetical protein